MSKENQIQNTMLGFFLTYDVLLEYEPEIYQLMFVTFHRDFGCWKVGDKPYILDIDFETGVMNELNIKKEILKSCSFTLVAK